MSSPATDFKAAANRVAPDTRLRHTIQTAMGKYETVRDHRTAAFQDWEGARDLAARTKFEAVNHLDEYLIDFVAKLESRGTRVHWAGTASRAREIILSILHEQKARVIVKSKTMTSEEIHLNAALVEAGCTVVESDLGEFIVQLRQEPPYHLVFPSMHLTRGEIRQLFADKLGDAPSDNPEDLTMVARRILRKKYLEADVGLTGANFAVAETGMVSITENEGNARLTAALPRTMITLLGIEKVLPRAADLALFLPMLATMGAGQALTGYNTLYGGPRQAGEPDGPAEFHVVLLDNQRTTLLADPRQREVLGCIRCGACLNVCPVFRAVGGHVYGTTYGGPIGSVITPHLRGLKEWKHLSDASSLCGACTETCPVKIDLHRHLLQNRQMGAQAKPDLFQKAAFKIFALLANRASFWAWTTRLARFGRILQGPVKGTRLDPAAAWTKTRELPPIARQTFREWWSQRK